MRTFQLLVIDPSRRRVLHFLCREDEEYSNLLNCKFLNSDPPSPDFVAGQYYTILLPDTFGDCVLAQLSKPSMSVLGLLDSLFYPINDVVVAIARVVEHVDNLLGHVHVLIPVAPREALYTVMSKAGQVARSLGLYEKHPVILRKRTRTPTPRSKSRRAILHIVQKQTRAQAPTVATPVQEASPSLGVSKTGSGARLLLVQKNQVGNMSMGNGSTASTVGDVYGQYSEEEEMKLYEPMLLRAFTLVKKFFEKLRNMIEDLAPREEGGNSASRRGTS